MVGAGVWDNDRVAVGGARVDDVAEVEQVVDADRVELLLRLRPVSARVPLELLGDRRWLEAQAELRAGCLRVDAPVAVGAAALEAVLRAAGSDRGARERRADCSVVAHPARLRSWAVHRADHEATHAREQKCHLSPPPNEVSQNQPGGVTRR